MGAVKVPGGDKILEWVEDVQHYWTLSFDLCAITTGDKGEYQLASFYCKEEATLKILITTQHASRDFSWIGTQNRLKIVSEQGEEIAISHAPYSNGHGSANESTTRVHLMSGMRYTVYFVTTYSGVDEGSGRRLASGLSGGTVSGEAFPVLNVDPIVSGAIS